MGFIVTNLDLPSRSVVWFYNKRRTAAVAEATIKEGKLPVNWTRLSCHRFRGNEVRLWLSMVPTLSGRLVLPKKIGNCSLTSLQQRLVKTGGRLVPPRGMRAITGCCWPRRRRGHLTRQRFGPALREEGSRLRPPEQDGASAPLGGFAAQARRCRCRSGSEPGETANRALRSDPVGSRRGDLAARQVGGEKQTKQVSGTAQLAALATQPRPGRSELDTRGR